MKGFNKLKLQTIDAIVFSNHVKQNNVQQEFPYHLKIVDANIATGIKKIDKSKSNNNICYAVFDNEELVHQSWVFKKKLLARQLGFTDCYTIGNSVTLASHRGKGIYPAVLEMIMQHFPDKQMILFANSLNTSSIHSVAKAGFVKLYRFKMIRLFGLKLFCKRYEN